MAPHAGRGDAGVVFESIVDAVTATAWVYPLILGVAALDAVFPVVPSETTLIAAAALAGAGELVLAFVLAAGAAGAVAGDNVAYVLGRAGQGAVLRRLLRHARWRQRLERAEAEFRRRGGTLIVVSRFVPGGRTATMLSAGLVGLPWRRFAAFDLAAALLWAGLATTLGWAGGRAVAHQPGRALLLALGVAAALTLVLEGVRRVAPHIRALVTG